MFKIIAQILQSKILQSKILRYSAIAGLVIATSGVVAVNYNANVSANTNLDVSTESNIQPNLKSEIQQDNLGSLDQLAELSPENLVERPKLLPSGKLLKQLNLSDTQLQKLKELSDRDRDSLREMSQKVKQGHRELKDLLASSEGSDAIRAKHNQLLSLQQELRQKHFERMLSMREILTPEQRSQLNQVIHKNRSRRDGMRERLEKHLDQPERPNLKNS